jgi:quinol-cytochrome oxidoreductase complex cytochrome b subunit
VGGLSTWFAERIPIRPGELRELTNEPVPNHLKRWWFCLGGTPAYLFLVQIVTGILLAFYYQASPATAWESVRYITEEAAYGWFLRGLHKWAATLMIASVVLHQMRVYFTGAYRKPRELNWIVGMGLLVLTLLTGFTGYSLVYEQLSYWGAIAKQLLLAGEVYNERTLSRFFLLHAAVLPCAMVALLAVHITLIRLQGVTEFKDEREPRRDEGFFSFFPDHFLSELVIGLVLMILLSTLATILPATMGPRADPLVTPEVIKPEWFFYVAFRWLKLFSGTAAVLSIGFIVFTMVVWPFVDALVRARWPRSEFSVHLGIVAVLALLALTVWEASVEH